MPLTIIGSGTLRPSPVRASPSHLVEVDGCAVLLDVGPGSVHGLARHNKPWWKLTHVVLSHFHTDHIGDLPHLLFALRWAAPTKRSHPLRVLGPPGLTERMRHLTQAHGDFMMEQTFPVEYVELSRSGSWSGDPELQISFCPTRHTEESVAVRVSTQAGTVGYTGDTGPNPDVGPFLLGSDLLICECGSSDPPAAENHLSPSSVAELARQALPGLLILTHIYPPLRPQSVPDLVFRAGYRGPTVCAEDGGVYPLPRE